MGCEQGKLGRGRVVGRRETYEAENSRQPGKQLMIFTETKLKGAFILTTLLE